MSISFHETRACPSIQLCNHCFLHKSNDGLCEGCSYSYHKNCLKKYCVFNCKTCSGGRLSRNKTIGCCGRINLVRHNDFKEIMNYKMSIHNPQTLRFKQTLIPILILDIRKYKIPQQFNEIDAWAIRLHDVMKRNGEFKSKDLKDYFSIDKDKKLILSTSSNDYLLEILWNKRSEIDFTEYSIDYWFPGHFSVYEDDSKFYQLSSIKRQQIHAIVSKSQFNWFCLSNTINIQLFSNLRDFPSIIIFTGKMVSKLSKNVLINEIQKADTYFSNDTSFFFIGGYSNIPKLKRNRAVYMLSQKWSMFSTMGMDLNRNFGNKEKKFDKETLLIKNLREEIKNVENKFNAHDGERWRHFN